MRERERARAHMSWRGVEKEGERGSQGGFEMSARILKWGSSTQTGRSGPGLESRVRCLTNGSTQVSPERQLLEVFTQETQAAGGAAPLELGKDPHRCKTGRTCYSRSFYSLTIF